MQKITLLIFVVLVSLATFYFFNTSSDEQELQEKLEQREILKQNLSIYLDPSATEVSIKSLEGSLKEQFPNIKVEYRSAEQVLASWREKNSNDEKLVNAMNNLESNPFGAELKIVTNSAKETTEVVEYVEFEDGKGIVKDLSYIPE